MDEFQKRIEQKLDSTLDKVHSIDRTLIQQSLQLKAAMRRLRAAEKAIGQVVSNFQTRFDTEISPVKKHFDAISHSASLLFKLIGVIAVVLGVVLSVFKIQEQFKSKPAPKSEIHPVPAPDVRPPPTKSKKR